MWRERINVKSTTGSGERVGIGLGGQPGMQEAGRGTDSTIDREGPELTYMEQEIQTAVAQIKQGFVSLSQSKEHGGCGRPALVRGLYQVTGGPGNLPLQSHIGNCWCHVSQRSTTVPSRPTLNPAFLPFWFKAAFQIHSMEP